MRPFGIAFAEGMELRLTRHLWSGASASREWIQDGATGLHSSQDPLAIAAAINRLLADSELRSRMGAAGRGFQQSRLTWDAVFAIHAQAFAPENGY